MGKTDLHGQPLLRSAQGVARLEDRNLDELIGLCRGIIADGVVNQTEAEVLLAWISRHEHGMGSFPANVLFARLSDVLADGVLDSDEARDVFELIAECVGGTGDMDAEPCTCTLPFDDPQPQLVFPRHNFALTGRFAWGPRKDIEHAIQFLGGGIKSVVSMQVDYLICGHFSSQDWIHTSHGRKIEAAMGLRDEGRPIAIISERHLSDYIRKTL